MRNLLIISLLIIITPSCSRLSDQKSTREGSEGYNIKSEIEIVQIQFMPAFISHSILTLDLISEKILFQRVGMREKVKRPLPPPNKTEKYEIFSPLTSYFKIDTLELIDLKDSILNSFTKLDFEDIERGTFDGICTSLIFGYDNNNFKDVEMDNNGTKNQYQLISKLIDICIVHETDSLNRQYLIELKGYY